MNDFLFRLSEHEHLLKYFIELIWFQMKGLAVCLTFAFNPYGSVVGVRVGDVGALKHAPFVCDHDQAKYHHEQHERVL